MSDYLAVCDRAAAHAAAALATLTGEDAAAALAHAERAEALRSTPEARRLLACAALLAGDFAGAWDAYRRAARPT